MKINLDKFFVEIEFLLTCTPLPTQYSKFLSFKGKKCFNQDIIAC